MEKMRRNKKPRVIYNEYNGVPKSTQTFNLSDECAPNSANFFSHFHAPTAMHREIVIPRMAAMGMALSTVFLPQGFPHTVTDDYLQYQIWDTIQAFASSITGALAVTAVFKGVGVGSETASVLAASITWLLKDGTGMLGHIAFAWARGSALDADCKKWRLIADGLNDLAFCFDLLAAHLPSIFFTPIACTTSLFRSIVGVAGGATRTAIIRHQSRRNNLADVAAKDSSQETVVNLVSLIVSLILLPLLNGHITLTWLCFLFCTIVHLFSNYKAIKSLHLDVLNQARLVLCVKSFINCGEVLSVPLCNKQEPIFSVQSRKRFFGCSYTKLCQDAQTIVLNINCHSAAFLCAYTSNGNIGYVVLDVDATKDDMLTAAFYIEFYAVTNKWPNANIIHEFREKLIHAGWNIDSHQLNFDEWRMRCVYEEFLSRTKSD